MLIQSFSTCEVKGTKHAPRDMSMHRSRSVAKVAAQRWPLKNAQLMHKRSTIATMLHMMKTIKSNKSVKTTCSTTT